MSKTDMMFSTILKKENGKLISCNKLDKDALDEFVKLIDEGQYIEVFYDANKDDKTLAQLAKIHKCIRVLAMHSGYTFHEMKLEVKKKCGLCIKKEDVEKNYTRCKSFSKCSKEELILVIEGMNEIGDFYGINLR